MTQIALNIDEKPKKKEFTYRDVVAYKNRSITDGYWCFFFLLTLTVWLLLARYYAVHEYRRPPNVDVNHDNNTIAVNDTTVFDYLSGKHWLIDLFTCNLSHMSANFESSGWIVIYANILYSLGLAAYSIASMRNDHMYQAQFLWALFFYMLTSISAAKGRLMENYPVLRYWFMPEIVLLAILFSKIHLKRPRNKILESVSTLALIYVMFTLPLAIILSKLYDYMMPVVFELGWDCPVSYVLLVINLYCGLIFHYVVHMTLSCSKDLAFDSFVEFYVRKFSILNLLYINPFRSLLLVLRYHFGTACYQATLIFPRLTALFVMNEPEFKRIPTIKKLSVIQGKLHDITPTLTGVDGTDYSDSLRQLLRDWPTRNMPNLQYFQGFRQITLTIFGILMSTNNLMIITFWFYGVDDPKLALATWANYLCLMIILNLLMRVLDTTWDALSLDLNVPIFFCSEKCELCRNCNECKFSVEECTFCADNYNEDRGEENESGTSKS